MLPLPENYLGTPFQPRLLSFVLHTGLSIPSLSARFIVLLRCRLVRGIGRSQLLGSWHSGKARSFGLELQDQGGQNLVER